MQAEKRKHKVRHTGKSIKLTAIFFLPQMLKARRAWNDVFQILKVNNHQPRLLIAKLSFADKEESKPLPIINTNSKNLLPSHITFELQTVLLMRYAGIRVAKTLIK